MFLISWNVAGWSATSAAIRESYGSLETFFALTGADIICLQECKGTWSKMERSPIDTGAADPPRNKRPKVPPLVAREGEPPISLATLTSSTVSSSSPSDGGITGWESFWSFSGKAHRGFNGVVTFVKKGLTHACDNQPFDTDSFNDEGRVVVTYHSLFTLVNVYVPNARGGSRSGFKQDFLLALRQRVLPRLRRESGKPVVLAGDFNCTYRAEDAHWTFRRLHLPRLLQLKALAENNALSERDWHARFPHLPKDVLERVTHLAVNTICAALLHEDESDDGGLLSSSPVALDAASGGGGTPHAAVESIRQSLEEAGKTRRSLLLSTDAPPVALETLIEAGLLSVHAADMTRAFPLSHNEEIFTVVQHAALAPHGDESIEFLGRLLQVPIVMSVTPDFEGRELLLPGPDDDDAKATRMWDTFLLTTDGAEAPVGGVPDHTHSYCPCPFTVWDQSKNRRLSNEGSRIDYILVDDVLKPLVVGRGNSENNTGPPRKVADPPAANARLTEVDFFSELKGKMLEDGVYRAMGGGAYPGASYDKTGIPPLADSARGVPFRGLPSTGLFITPPQFSDHIGVCVLFKPKDDKQQPFTVSPRVGKVIEKSGKCMYRPPVGLQSFFQKKAEGSKCVPTAPLASAQPLPSAPEPAQPPRKALRRSSGATASSDPPVVDVVEISSDGEE